MNKIFTLCVLALITFSCGKKAADVIAEGVTDILLPSAPTPCDLPSVDTPAEGTPICGDVTESQ